MRSRHRNFKTRSDRWRRCGRGLVLACCAWTMTACAQPAPLLPDREPLPPDLVQPCPPLQSLTDGTGGAVLQWIVDAAFQYRACQRGKQALIDAVTGGPP